MTPETATARSALAAESLAREGNDPIFALNAEARSRAAQGESILNATLGALMHDDGSLAVLPSVADAFAGVSALQAAGYAPISGVPAYLEAVRQDLYGGTDLLDRTVAVAAPGGTGAIYLAMVNFLEPGQAALTTDYFWGPYPVIADQAQRSLETFRMFDAEGRLDLEALRQAVDDQIDRQGRALVILNFPCHNPTGYSLDADEWTQVAGLLRAAGSRAPVAVVLDCAYYRFAGPTSADWLAAVPEMAESCTVLAAWTASKSFTQYGARIGALVALHSDPEERRRIANALNYSCRATWSNCNHQGQLAITRLLTDPDVRDRANREREELRMMLDNRVAAFNALQEGTGLRIPRYEGGFFVSVFTDDPQGAGVSTREDGVYVVPIRGALRVAVCSTPESGMERLVKALRRAPGTTE